MTFKGITSFHFTRFFYFQETANYLPPYAFYEVLFFIKCLYVLIFCISANLRLSLLSLYLWQWLPTICSYSWPFSCASDLFTLLDILCRRLANCQLIGYICSAFCFISKNLLKQPHPFVYICLWLFCATVAELASCDSDCS